MEESCLEVGLPPPSDSIPIDDPIVSGGDNNDEEGERDDDLLPLKSINKSYQPFRDGGGSGDNDDTRSVHTYASSTGSTIAPDVIKKRVKASLEKKKRSAETRRIRAKGDANAVTRQRRDNKHEIDASKDAFWG